jgi:hypothetical protein
MNMQFSNIFHGNSSRKYNTNSINITFLKKGMKNNSNYDYERINNENLKKNINKQLEEKTENTRVRWGPSTWFLFHTLAEKVKENEFDKIKEELLNNIKSICMNLPCPTCREHATLYIQRLNYNSIKTKEDLKLFLFNFHNEVNIRKNVPLFLYQELENKYSIANTVNIIKNFIEVFQYKNKGFNMIANEMQKQRQVETLKLWFNNNIEKFEI